MKELVLPDQTSENKTSDEEMNDKTEDSNYKKNEITANQIKEQLEEFLYSERIFENIDGDLVVDKSKMLNDDNFKKRLYNLNFGTANGLRQRGSSIKMIEEFFSGLEAYDTEEYKKSLVAGEIPKIKKIFYRKEKSEKDEIQGVKNNLLDFLEKNQIIKKKDGMLIMDLEKFKSGFFDQAEIKYLGKAGFKKFYGTRITVFELLRDIKVISKKDYDTAKAENATVTPKPLFNIPESKKEAFNEDMIKRQEYYLNLWDIYGASKGKNWKYVEAKNGDQIDLRELALATAVFRDLNGRRNKDNELQVYDKEKEAFVKINDVLIIKNIGKLGTAKKGAQGINRIQGVNRYLRKISPELKNLISIRDFNLLSGEHGGLRAEKKVRDSGDVSISSAQYYIGKEYFIFSKDKIPTKNIKVVELDRSRAGIVVKHKDRETLRYTFSLLSREEKEKKLIEYTKKSGKELPRKGQGGLIHVNKNEMEVRLERYNNEKENFQLENESFDNYNQRISYLTDYSYISKVSDKFFEESKIRIQELSWKEQQWLIASYYEMGIKGEEEKIINFTKRFGLNGLRTFLSCEYDIENGQKIIGLGEKLDPKIAEAIFSKYNELINLTKKSIEDLEKKLGNKDLDFNENKSSIISRNILTKANNLLVSFSDSIKNNSINEEKLFQELEKISADIILLNEIIRELPREEVAGLDLRKIEDIDKREDMPASEILKNKELVEKIKNIIREQFPEGDDDEFIKECQNKENLKIIITLANKEVLSFFTKEKVSENFEYVDWFISNPDAPIKGLGEATLKLGFDDDTDKAKSYYAVAKPHVKSFHILVEKLGFVSFKGSTEDNEYKNHYARARKLLNDKDLISKNISADENKSLNNTLKTICQKPNKTEDFIFKGERLIVCKVIYHGQNHKDDILKTDADGWILSEIERQYKKGNVLARFIPESEKKENQTFYAVFEKDNSSPNEREELEEIINHKSGSKLHSDSKNALSI